MEDLLAPPAEPWEDWVVLSTSQSDLRFDLPNAPSHISATVLDLQRQLATVIKDKGRSDSRVAKLEARLKHYKELLAAVNVSDEYDGAVVAMIMERHNKLAKVLIDQHQLQKNAEDAVPCSCCGCCGDCIATNLRLLGLSACARGVAA